MSELDGEKSDIALWKILALEPLEPNVGVCGFPKSLVDGDPESVLGLDFPEVS